MRVPGRKLLLRSYRWMRSRALGGVVVLGYHRVTDDRRDPFDLAIDPDSFAAHVRFLARHAQPMGLHEAMDTLQRGRPPARAVVLTFDDGYADTASCVLPILEQHAVPATVFVTTGGIGREFWWDELTRIILDTPELPRRLRVMMGGAVREWSLDAGTTPSARQHLLLSMADALRPLNATDRRAAMAEVRQYAGEPPALPRHRALTTDEIRHLAASRYIEIGAHTVSHPVLPGLPRGEQVAEVEQSRACLEQITARRIRSFSYPHGLVSSTTRAAVREAGFDVACCSVPDVLTRRADRLALPRLWVDQRDERTFARWMKWWLTN